MDSEEKAIEYAVNKFHGLGVAVSHEGVGTVLDYVDEYYMNVWQPGEDEHITVTAYTEEEKRAYIQDHLPDIPHNIIKDVLNVEDKFFGGVEHE